MRIVVCLLLVACGRQTTDVRVNAFLGSWSGVAYTSSLTELYTAKVTFSDDRVSWRINKQPGLADELVAEGGYLQNDSGFLVIALDSAFYDRATGNTSLVLQRPCFADDAGACVIDANQATQYSVSATNVQFSLTMSDGRVMLTNVNRAQ